MDSKQLGEAGLQGWRGGVADRVAPGAARRTSADVEHVRTAIGGLFLVLSTLDLVKATRLILQGAAPPHVMGLPSGISFPS